MKSLILYFFLIFFLGACDNFRSNEGAKEKARSEAEINNEIAANNEKRLRTERAQRMENDLNQRFLFYQALEGLYRGSFEKNSETHILQVSIHASIPLYKPDRIRELSEIEEQLSNLSFIVRVQQWPASMDQKVGQGDVSSVLACQFIAIKPDLQKGTIPLRTDSCNRWYQLLLSSPKASEKESADNSELLASQILSGQIKSIEYLKGHLSIANNPNFYPLSLKKISMGGSQ